ncbi:TetR/AcrR family transcriptional regulator [Paractinoplanes lichenicola]|uniref:WHG domain-containing protein n=1 Tax=Paractinoplanes lichenicola TaxID=2802976 RepID=A0ABS1VPT0_9ACTN|nr:TetR-like C-terminal domain-containing protein [Actinoplanes lichenicola]MBL7256736.1 WHG domain-containing protein [Actinoplanes lichenicola]
MAGEDVKAALVRHGALLLDEQGLAGFTGREVARRAGVSHGAPRRYFPTLAALLSAVAATGFADLRSRMEAATGGTPSGSSGGSGKEVSTHIGPERDVSAYLPTQGKAVGGSVSDESAHLPGGGVAGGGPAGDVSAHLPGRRAAAARLAELARAYVEFARERPAMFELMFRHDLLEGSGEHLREHSTPIFEAASDLVARTGVREPQLAAVDLWAGVHGLAVLASRRALGLITGESIAGLLERQLRAHLKF